MATRIFFIGKLCVETTISQYCLREKIDIFLSSPVPIAFLEFIRFPDFGLQTYLTDLVIHNAKLFRIFCYALYLDAIIMALTFFLLIMYKNMFTQE